MHERRTLRGWLVGAGSAIVAVALLVPFWVAAAPGSTGTVQQVAIGAYVTFTGSGFAAGETISLQATAPDGSVMSLTGTEATGTGEFTVSVSFPSAGLWQVIARGDSSGNEYSGQFSVGLASPTLPSPLDTSPVPTLAGTVTAPVSATIPAGLPLGTTVTTVGTTVSYSGSGFTVGEEINIWSTAPDGTPAFLSRVNGDATGAFSSSTAFPTGGLWQVTARGKASGFEVINRFYVTSDTAATPAGTPVATATGPSVANIVKVSADQRVTFTAGGFTANEVISVWTTAPAGAVATLDPVQANSTGRITITTTFPSTGLWQITAHGQTSSREVVGRYQVAAA